MVKKNKELVKKPEKTKSADTAVDHVKERRRRDEEETKRRKKAFKKAKQEQAELQQRRKEETYARSYDRLFEDDDAMEAHSNQKVSALEHDEDEEDDDEDFNMDDLGDLL